MALQLRPDFAQAHYQLAAVLRDAQKFGACRNLFARLRLRPTFVQARACLLTVLEFQGKVGEPEPPSPGRWRAAAKR